MANLCYNSVFLVGDPSKIQEIEKIFEENQGKTGLEAVAKKLGVEMGRSASYDEGLGFVKMEPLRSTDRAAMFFSCVTAWTHPEDFLKNICEKYDLEYVCMAEPDGDLYIENDPEKQWFKDSFILDLQDDFKGIEACQLTFETSEALLNYVNKEMNPDEPAYTSLWSFEHDMIEAEIGNICEVERYGNQVVHPDNDYQLSLEEFEELFGEKYEEINADPPEEEMIFD